VVADGPVEEDDRPLSAATIKAIESGVNGLRPELAARITALTGVDTRPMLKGRLSKPKTIDGRPFSVETLRQWKEKRFEDEELGKLVEALSGRIGDILERHSNSTSGLRLAYCLLSEALGTVTRSMEPLPDDTFLPEVEELHDVIDQEHPTGRMDGWGQVRRMASKPRPAPSPPKKKPAKRAAKG